MDPIAPDDLQLYLALLLGQVSLLPAIVALATVVLVSCLISRFAGAPVQQGRFAAIDGLRGYLAFFVFLYHATVWYYYLRSGAWSLPPSNLFIQFGQASVALFFMITGFLFSTKLMDERRRGTDWTRFFVSRLLRLLPLYLLAMAVLFLLVAFRSHWQLQQQPWDLAATALQWITFTAFGEGELNGVKNTFAIVSGVTWSLPYEWLFYCFLPLMALATGARPSLRCLTFALLACLVLVTARKPAAIHVFTFGGGVAAALLVKVDALRRVARSHVGSVLLALVLGIELCLFPSPRGTGQLILLSLGFALIAAGADLFGCLTTQASRTLGEMAYSIYLLHGLLLFLVFEVILGAPLARSLSPFMHWAIVVGIVPVLVLVARAAFTAIERPSMARVAAVTAWLRARRWPCAVAAMPGIDAR